MGVVRGSGMSQFKNKVSNVTHISKLPGDIGESIFGLRTRVLVPKTELILRSGRPNRCHPRLTPRRRGGKSADACFRLSDMQTTQSPTVQALQRVDRSCVTRTVLVGSARSPAKMSNPSTLLGHHPNHGL